MINMKNYKDRVNKAKEAFRHAEYILIGAGSGFSAAAGIEYFGERFTDNFSDFIEKYNMEDLYSSSFYPFKTLEEKWAYWARHISLNRFETSATELYKILNNKVKEKNYFVLTTNVEHQFWKAGFKDEKIFATQGDYGYLQCEKGCHDTLYDNEKLISDMLKQIKDCKVPSNLVPKCPKCGGEMDVNLRKDEYFVQDEQWYKACDKYKAFVEEIKDKKAVFIELGVGFNTPGIIRYPFEKMVYDNPNATLIRINKHYPDGVAENKFKTISFDEEMIGVISSL